MDKTEQASGEDSNSEPAVTADTESDQKKLKQNVKSFKKDLADNKSNGLTNSDPASEPDSKYNKPSETIEAEQAREKPSEAVPADKPADENPETVDDTGDKDQRDSDAQTPVGEKDETSSNADLHDSMEAEPANEKRTNAAQQPESPDAQIAGETENAKSEKVDTADAAEGQADKHLSGAGKGTADTDDPNPETTEAVDPDHDRNVHPPQKTATSKTSKLKIAVSAVLIFAVFSGFFIFENKSKKMGVRKEKPQTSEKQEQPSKPTRNEILDIQLPVIPGAYNGQLNEISALRDTLLKKQAEVRALKQSYRHSIEELEKEILDEQRKGEIQTFLQATGNKRIVFSLKTIQRRRAYIGQLEQPFEWVSRACEELLYIKRRVIMDLQVSAVASGIDMDGHVQQMHLALQKYQPTADKLAIDPTDARLDSLETIWERVQNRQYDISTEPAYSKNQIISDQICAGNFNRLGELFEISTETAKCIIQMHGADLFLNQISEISPGVARQLCQWKGSWICMNGIRALSPRAAHYLFQWDGNWISLNGLTEFPAEIGIPLLKWGGGQLELMGLQYTGDSHENIAIEYLAQWERSGGKLFVPGDLRDKIDALHEQSS